MVNTPKIVSKVQFTEQKYSIICKKIKSYSAANTKKNAFFYFLLSILPLFTLQQNGRNRMIFFVTDGNMHTDHPQL